MYLCKEDGNEDRKGCGDHNAKWLYQASNKLQFAIAAISTTTSHHNATIIFSITMQKLAIA